jgi:hypothetical protein
MPCAYFENAAWVDKTKRDNEKNAIATHCQNPKAWTSYLYMRHTTTCIQPPAYNHPKAWTSYLYMRHTTTCIQTNIKHRSDVNEDTSLIIRLWRTL